MEENIQATAFLSCSLREEDKDFVDYVSAILLQHNIKPVGTVGKHDASPENPAVLIKKNIPNADMLVIAATPRYLQKDITTKGKKKGLSEMLHVETGMAYVLNKPVIVFAQEGTDVGNFIPNITQYITLDGSKEDFYSKKELIFSLLNKAYLKVKEIKGDQSIRKIGTVLVIGLAIYGGYKLIEKLFK